MISKKYTIVKTENDLNLLKQYLVKWEFVAYDTETTGLNTRKASVIGASFCGEEGISFYLPTYYWDSKLQSLKPTNMANRLKEILDIISTKKLIMHNGSFDIRVTKSNYNVDLTDSLYCDTIMLKHTVEEEQPFSLKEIAILKQHELGLNMYEEANKEQIELKESIKANGGSTTKTNMEMYKADLEVLGKYGAADTDLTLRIYHLYMKKLKEENLEKFFFEDEVMPLYKEVTIPMENNGIKLDIPKIKKMESEIEKDLIDLEKEVHDSLDPLASEVIQDTLNKNIPITNSGRFAQAIVDFSNIDLPKTKSGKASLTAKTLATLDSSNAFVDFLKTGTVHPTIVEDLKRIQKELYLKTTNSTYVFNISSKQQLSTLFFDHLGEDPLSYTPKNAPQMNDAMIEELADKYDAARLLQIYNKLTKIKSAYVDRFLRESEDGYFYPTFKQFGTISGRYGSDLQQLNRPIPEEDRDSVHPLIYKYNNLIREFFIPDEGRIFIDDDYESLEPRCFAADAQDAKLLEIFEKNYDMYSTVAIEVENLSGKYSADKKADNYLKNHNPTLRQQAKGYSLGIRYGLREFKLSHMLNMSLEDCMSTINNYISSDPIEHHNLVSRYLEDLNKDANKFTRKSELELQDYRLLAAKCIIDSYFDKFKLLKRSMDSYVNQLKTSGKVISPYGRVRHLERAKKIYDTFGESLLDPKNTSKIAKKFHKERDEIKKFRRLLSSAINNALNFPIQSTAASIVNRAAIAVNREFKKQGIDGLVIAQIHDQLIFDVAEKDVDKAMEIVQNKMETTTLLKGVKLSAPPAKAINFKEGH